MSSTETAVQAATEALGTRIRRVVTGHDASGKAVIVSDGPAPFVHTNPLRPGYASTDIWRTHAMPAPIEATPKDTTADGPRRQLPTRNGTVLRINTLAPEPESVRKLGAQEAQLVFSQGGNAGASTFAANHRHPMMHRTETVDYAVILSGEVTMLLDDSEVNLKTGDVVVQVGTNHAWVNRSDAPCQILFAMFDGAFEPELKAVLGSDGH
ncbi:MAG: cupin domain-containing protein [Pseudomonadota bacterium]